MDTINDLLGRKILVFDGAMGTSIQVCHLSVPDFGGPELEGCNENLNLTRPDVIASIHENFLIAGADVIETNTFGGTRLVLAEYGLEAKTIEINRTAAEIARKVTDDYSTAEWPRFVAGSLGPGTKLPSLGQISFDTVFDYYREQATGLLEGGVDLLSIETCQDLLQAKAALMGVLDARERHGTDTPILLSVTIEKDLGTMLLGTEISAALATFEPYPITAFGMNCATGPEDMHLAVQTLGHLSPFPLSVMPNAGLPENVDGKPVYHLEPESLAAQLREFVERDGAWIVGGCCGTTDTHIKAIADAMKGIAPVARDASMQPSVSSLFSAVTLQQEPAPLIVGERANANGGKQFRELLLADRFDDAARVAKDQERERAHVLDVSVAYVGRNEERDMDEIVSRFVRQTTLPLMIDSTETPAIETALKRHGGRAIINSVNLEDGEDRFREVASLAKRYGAALILLTIDEDGMALTSEKKVAIAERMIRLACDTCGLRPVDLIIDALTFTLANPKYARAGVETMTAIREIKRRFPDVHTILGVSNISFGLSPYARTVLNSVFMHEATVAGLDLAIVNWKRILPLNRIEAGHRELARQIVQDDRAEHSDPLTEFLHSVKGEKAAARRPRAESLPIEDELKLRIIDADPIDLDVALAKAMEKHDALTIINDFLLEGMKTVGELFGSGQMQLPFVLQSAETMKAAVQVLEPHMPRVDGREKGTIVLATVRGDVHDIGKNLADIILTNNGYRVINLGIKVQIAAILEAFDEHQADAIGMSGLLVKSTAVMKENLEEMTRKGRTGIPVIVGGAALNRRFVNDSLAPAYDGVVRYARDAFDGLRFMEEIRSGTLRPPESAAPGSPADSTPKGATAGSTEARASGPTLDVVPVPRAPFFGTRVVKDVAAKELFAYVNKAALFRGQWQYRRRRMDEESYDRLIRETVEPLFAEWTERCIRDDLLAPAVIYGYFPCVAEGDSLVLLDPDTGTERTRFDFPRQRKKAGLCIADYFRPRSSGETDVLGVHLVTVGSRIIDAARSFYEQDRYHDYLILHGLAVESAEALAEYWHARMRKELGIAVDDGPAITDLIKGRYRGARYSFGYPACPNLADQEKLLPLLDAGRIGVTLTEGHMLDPEASTSALVVHHPHAKYFTV